MEQFESTISWQLTTYLKPYHRRVSSECSINQGELESFPAFTSSFVLISWLFHWNHTPSWTDHNIIDAQSLRSLAHPTQSKGRLKPPRRFMYCLEQIGKTSANYPSNADKLMTIKLHFRRKTFDFPGCILFEKKQKKLIRFLLFVYTSEFTFSPKNNWWGIPSVVRDFSICGGGGCRLNKSWLSIIEWNPCPLLWLFVWHAKKFSKIFSHVYQLRNWCSKNRLLWKLTNVSCTAK